MLSGNDGPDHSGPTFLPPFPESAPTSPLLPAFPDSAQISPMLPAFPDSAPISPLLPTFPDSAPNSPLLPAFPDSARISPLARISPMLPAFPDLASTSAMPAFPASSDDLPDLCTMPDFPMTLSPGPPKFNDIDADVEDDMPPFPDFNAEISLHSTPMSINSTPPPDSVALLALPNTNSAQPKVPQKETYQKKLARSPNPPQKQKKVVSTRPRPYKHKLASGPTAKRDIGEDFCRLGDLREVDPRYLKPTLAEMQNAHTAIWPDNGSRLPYHIGYELALKAGEEQLDRVEYLEEQAWNAGESLEHVQGNLERWLDSWDL
ncbi:hypothetical protein BYT27DRAFT_7253963 [Phlegmacium glaucopus]|nr:hypothetical protein BYT27DRAFT_7253963 [Phlegmacium glaucopus]